MTEIKGSEKEGRREGVGFSVISGGQKSRGYQSYISVSLLSGCCEKVLKLGLYSPPSPVSQILTVLNEKF